jgi:hypothetical protein
MFNSIIKNLNGHGGEAASIDAALVQLSRDRDETRAKIDTLQKQRHQLLLDDASDSDLDKIERQLDRATTRLEKLNLSEPLLRERLADAQTAVRKRRWHALHQAHHTAAFEFLSLARACAEKHREVIATVETAQNEWFAGLVASTMPRTPNIEGSPLLATDLLDIFERSLSPPSPRRAAKVKPAKADASLWDQKSVNYNHPANVQLRTTLIQPPAGTSLQHAWAGADTTGAISPLKPLGKINADALADDLGALGPGEVRVLVLRRGFSGGLDGGQQSQAGRKTRMLLETAKIAAKNGAVEILNEAPTAAPTKNVGTNAGEGV